MAEVLRSDALAGMPHGFSLAEGLTAQDILPGGTMLRARQVHSPDVVTVRAPWETPPEADALVTDQPGLILGVVTADCGPVLFADRTAGVIGAAHAGWRGAHGGVLENTVAAMEALGAARARIVAVLGPTIARASYEVDDGFRGLFDADDARFFTAGRPGHFHFDLPGYIGARLAKAGVGRFADLARDTYTDEGLHSFRRATHRGVPTGGRQTSAIALS